MGKTIAKGVIDSHLRVYGVDNLRFIDASIITVIPDGRIQSPVYILGEKVSRNLSFRCSYTAKLLLLNILKMLIRNDK